MKWLALGYLSIASTTSLIYMLGAEEKREKIAGFVDSLVLAIIAIWIFKENF